jgi:hypothetical protein
MYWCPQVSSHPNEAHPGKAPSNYYVTHLCLAKIEITYHSTLVLASPGRKSLKIVVAGVFSSTSTTYWPLLLQPPGIFHAFCGMSLATSEVQRWQRALLMVQHRGMLKEDGVDLFKAL